jgi:hypothetical protein
MEEEYLYTREELIARFEAEKAAILRTLATAHAIIAERGQVSLLQWAITIASQKQKEPRT